jgi:kynurenine 3-monooxygenase
MEKIAVVGGGLVGAMQAIYMAQKGFEVDVFERRGDIRNALFVAGKSINLALSDRGWEALRKINMEKDIREISIPMRGRKIHNSDGSLNFQAYGIDDQSIWSVSRGGLNQRLLIKADSFDNCNLFFEHKCINLDPDTNTLVFEYGNEVVEKTYDRILATDGAFSAIRLNLEKSESITSSIATLEHGYKELLIPTGSDGLHQLDPNSLHIWPRGGFMLIALANLDGSFTVTLFMPFEGKDSFEKLQSDDEIEAFFRKEFPDALQLMPDFINDFKSNPTASLVTVKSFPWNYLDKILLMGDAAHAIVPFYGQGMNCGFEDCSILDHLMNEFKNDWSKIAPAYTQARKINGDAIADLALRNYIEMRDLTAQPEFLLRKKIEGLFTKNHPNKWLPLYSQVTFSHIPYSKAIENARIQDEIMNEVMRLNNIEDKWDSKEVEDFIIQKLQLINAY